jgi:hypothetical protein
LYRRDSHCSGSVKGGSEKNFQKTESKERKKTISLSVFLSPVRTSAGMAVQPDHLLPRKRLMEDGGESIGNGKVRRERGRKKKFG